MTSGDPSPRDRAQLATLLRRLSIASLVLGLGGAALAWSMPASGDAGWVFMRRALLSVFVAALVGLALALSSLALDRKSKRTIVLVLVEAALVLSFGFIP